MPLDTCRSLDRCPRVLFLSRRFCQERPVDRPFPASSLFRARTLTHISGRRVSPFRSRPESVYTALVNPSVNSLLCLLVELSLSKTRAFGEEEPAGSSSASNNVSKLPPADAHTTERYRRDIFCCEMNAQILIQAFVPSRDVCLRGDADRVTSSADVSP